MPTESAPDQAIAAVAAAGDATVAADDADAAVADLGRQIYAAMRAELEASHPGKLVVIDTKTGDYELGDYHGSPSDLAITRRLLQRRPDAVTWAELVGGQYVFARPAWRRTMERHAARHNELEHDSKAKAARAAAATHTHLGKRVQFDYTPDEVADIGRQIYAGIQAEMEAHHWGRLVVIELKTGDYEVADYHRDRDVGMELIMKLRERHPDCLTWTERVGGGETHVVPRLSWRQTMELYAELQREKEQAND